MKDTLKKLLDTLDSISEEHEEVTDTDVRDQMYEAVYHGFILQVPVHGGSGNRLGGACFPR